MINFHSINKGHIKLLWLHFLYLHIEIISNYKVTVTFSQVSWLIKYPFYLNFFKVILVCSFKAAWNFYLPIFMTKICTYLWNKFSLKITRIQSYLCYNFSWDLFEGLEDVLTMGIILWQKGTRDCTDLSQNVSYWKWKMQKEINRCLTL